MKKEHAILITAYKNYKYLRFLTAWLLPYFDVYIHVDKKSNEIGVAEKEELRNLGCYVISNYSVCWGGVNHLYAVLDMLRMAVSKEYAYYHLISGEDIPVRSYAEIQKRFFGNDKIYISSHDAVNDPNWSNRYRYWYLFKNKDIRAFPYRYLNGALLRLQKLFHVQRKRIGKETAIFKGYLYGDFPNDAVRYALKYVDDNPEFMKDIEYTYIPEEFFFQTILGNSPLRHRIANNCLRYSIWEYKHGSVPGYLDEEDWTVVTSGDYLFARKVNFSVSASLISLAENRYKHNQ